MTAPRTEVRHGAAFWAGVVVGWAVIGFGVWGTFDESNLTHPASFARWFFGGLVSHDLVLVPVVLLVGVAISRWAPARIRPVVAATLLVAGPVVLYSVPLLLGYGGRPANPSALPRDYGEGLVWVLGSTVGLAGVAAALRAWGQGSRGERGPRRPAAGRSARRRPGRPPREPRR